MGVVINMAVSSLSPIITLLLSGIVAVASSYFTNYFLKKDRLGIEIKSKHRQDWINSLRTDIAYICAKANFIANNLNAIIMEENGKDQTTNNIKRIFAYNQLEEKSFEVLLFLNPDEKLHQKLEKRLEELNKVLIDYINTSRNLDIFELNSTLAS